MKPSVKVPLALQMLIQTNNKLLEDYQRELSQQVLEANLDTMKLLNLNPQEGWRLDTTKFEYVQVEPDAPSLS